MEVISREHFTCFTECQHVCVCASMCVCMCVHKRTCVSVCMCGYLILWMCVKSSGRTEVYLSSIRGTKCGPLPTCSWAWRDRTLSPDPISEPITIIKGSPSAITDAICGDIMKRETTPPTTWVMLLRPILTHILKELLKSWTSVVSLRQVNQWGL